MTNVYLDEEEKEMIESFGDIDISEIEPPTAALQKELKKSAKEYLRKETKMNIRIDPYELDKIKEVAAGEGLKYQTFVKSILHKYITGQLIDKRNIG